MLGVTAHLSTDIAAIPLLWVVPLAVYLATFVVAFSRWFARRPPRGRAAQPSPPTLAITGACLDCRRPTGTPRGLAC